MVVVESDATQYLNHVCWMAVVLVGNCPMGGVDLGEAPVAVAVEFELIAASTAAVKVEHHITIGFSGLEYESVVAPATSQGVSASRTIDTIIAREPADGVVARGTDQIVVARGTDQIVVATRVGDRGRRRWRRSHIVVGDGANALAHR